VRRLRIALLLWLAGCPKAPPTSPEVADPLALVAQARAESLPGPVYAPFTAVVALPESRVTASGTLVVAPPDRFRIELRGPIGPPQVVVTCDGDALRTWVLGKNTVFTVPHADASVATLLFPDLSEAERPGGSDTATSLLLGRLPAIPGTPVASAPAGVEWTRGDGGTVVAALDPLTAHLVSLEVHGPAGSAFAGAWTPGAFPEAARIDLPNIGVTLDLKFGEWKGASPMDAAFMLPTPAGAEERIVDLDSLPPATPAP
jgi:hypothetical protein